MSLHRLSHIEVGIPAHVLDATRAFYRGFGLTEVAPGRFVTRDGGEQLALVAAPRRALLALSLGVDRADDLGRAAPALAGLGLAARLAGDALHTREPVTGIRVTLAVERRLVQKSEGQLAANGPGRARTRDRARPLRAPSGRVRTGCRMSSRPRRTPQPRAASSSKASASP